MSTAVRAPLLLLLLLSLPVAAVADESGTGAELFWSGYGELHFGWLGYGPDQNRVEGSQEDSRLVFDQTRFVLELEGEMPGDWEWEIEIEFEHGGTGSALELEYEEFGEFEQEVEKAGEVLLEEMYLKKVIANRFSFRIGRFYTAVGLLSTRYRPIDYLGTTRPESETAVIPAVWDEMGVEASALLGDLRLTLQVLNGLDSTGFSSQRWVASGHQRRFETVRATDLAFVGRVDYTPIPGVALGVSSYYGGTTRNRPKPDLVKACAAGDPTEVAPCGYVSAPVTIVDFHFELALAGVRAAGVALWGSLDEADAISTRNARLSNLLGVLRSPVSDEALAVWVEAGYDLARLFAWEDIRLEPYVRLDYYDTIFNPRASLYDDPRFERTVYTAGVGVTLVDSFVAKVDFSRRQLGADRFRPEDAVTLATGFVY